MEYIEVMGGNRRGERNERENKLKNEER